MFAVIFEVQPRSQAWGYLSRLCQLLRPELDGPRFVDNERFRSLRRPGWLLSLFRYGGTRRR